MKRQAVSLVSSLLLLPAITAGLLLAFGSLPPIWERPPWPPTYDYRTWVGQGPGFAYFWGALLTLLLYCGKAILVRDAGSRAAAVYWFGLLVAASLPWVWFLVVLDWHNAF